VTLCGGVTWKWRSSCPCQRCVFWIPFLGSANDAHAVEFDLEAEEYVCATSKGLLAQLILVNLLLETLYDWGVSKRGVYSRV